MTVPAPDPLPDVPPHASGTVLPSSDIGGTGRPPGEAAPPGPRTSVLGPRALAWLAAILAVAAVALSIPAAGDGVLAVDLRLARWLQRPDGPIVDALVDAGNALGSTAANVIIALPVALALLWRRAYRDAALVFFAGLARAANPPLKAIFDSPRPTPDLVRVIDAPSNLGFPSGHAMGSILLYCALAVVAHRRGWPAPVRRLTLASAVLVPLLNGWARVHDGAHWPSDVLGGYLWGSLLLVGVVAVTHKGRARAARHEA